MLPLLPLAVLAGAGHYGYKRYKTFRAFTPERKALYERAMNSPTDPNELRAIADSFEKEGLKKQADLLRKRAVLRTLPESVLEARRNVFKKAMKSTDPAAILEVAKAHEEVGAVGAAQALRIQAETLKAVKGAT